MTLPDRCFIGVVVTSGLFPSSIADGKTWRIPLNAPTIQAGIDSCEAGDTVLVTPGRYFESVDFLGRPIVLKSEGGASVTTLDPSLYSSGAVRMRTGSTGQGILDGFTITGGAGFVDGPSRHGGAIIGDGASIIIKNNRIVTNSALCQFCPGGAIWALSFRPEAHRKLTIENNDCEDNDSSGTGGAIDVNGYEVLIVNNIFRNNRCGTDGGALFLPAFFWPVTVEGNEFWENQAGDHGGAINTAGSFNSPNNPVYIKNNLFVRNRALKIDSSEFLNEGPGGAIAAGELQAGEIQFNTFVANVGNFQSPAGAISIAHNNSGPTRLSVTHNIFYKNEGYGIGCYSTYSGKIENNLFWSNTPGDLGSGCPAELADKNLFQNPLFCDPENDEYTLAKNSPALKKIVMGAFPEAGCNSIYYPLTWGRLKARYTNAQSP